MTQASGVKELTLIRWKHRMMAGAVVAFVCVLGITLTAYISALLTENAHKRLQNETLARLSEARARLEGTISATLYISQGLVSFTAINGELTQRQFRRFAEELSSANRHVKLIALAPGNVVRYVHPLLGNLRVLGLDYSKTPAQWPVVKRVMDERRTVVAGPVDLVQGGRALIARSPVLIPMNEDDGRSERRYWGVASVVIDMDALFEDAGIRPEMSGYQFALRGADGLGPAGGMILGDPALFETPLSSGGGVILPVSLPNGMWQMASRPVGGWVATSPEVQIVQLVGLGVTFAIALLSVMVVIAQQRARSMALHDALTGLPNRRLLEDRLEQLAALGERTGLGFQVFFVDLNAFKPINDTFGHAVGDLVLQEVGKRLRAETRDSDTIARIGGDEFVVVVPGMTHHQTTANIAARLREAVSEPVRAGDNIIAIRASVGWAVYPDDATTIPEILELADQRMYREKLAAA
ncbi:MULTISPECIES: diguanylate cyclase domain-containing protein [unclassified Stappia]|uniref:diguanylate cyclase domain-containing protein n=1 Tax=unclassified Stappia TaxID=2629676 RepID=UPI001645CD20|nr:MULTISPECIES: diguanylate cyclase [unclassified Stappia]